MRYSRQLSLRCALVLIVLAACGRSDSVLSPHFAQGTYTLESVHGRGAASGIMVLSPTGDVARRVRYAQAGGTQSQEYVDVGTFRLTAGGVVELQLREDGGRSSNVWQPRATLTGSVLALQYPDPADGPDIVESYRRQ
ncbi:MAG TPA: hypothetical protein VJO33_01985 [Gemmatimonadaceae bacterium]|nr:hypothetical protein [Gemmatimonadaceae bacterium]